MEVSVRADKLASAGTEITIEFSIWLATICEDRKRYQASITLTVADRTETNLVPTEFTSSMKAKNW